jgi:hypothetical protein
MGDGSAKVKEEEVWDQWTMDGLRKFIPISDREGWGMAVSNSLVAM